jgi:hypothetical protein
MFKIIGADQKEYGPVSAEQLRQWIADGRAYAQTQARREGETDWKPLSAFEEFAEAFRATAANPPLMRPPVSSAPPPFGSREAALRAVKGPAIALIIIASIAMAYYLVMTVASLIMGPEAFHQQMPSNLPLEMPSGIEKLQGPLSALSNFIGFAINGLTLFGAIKMLRLQQHGFAVAGSIAVMMPCGCCCLPGLPFGIWALVVLNKPEVKSFFS